VNIIGRDGGGGPRESYVSGTCRRRREVCEREKGGRIYICSIRRRHECVSRLFSYGHTHKKTAAMHHTHAHTGAHLYRCRACIVLRVGGGGGGERTGAAVTTHI